MKGLKRAVAAMAAAGALSMGAVLPAQAAVDAGQYGGAGSTVSLSTYNSARTSYLPSPPSSVPTYSTITDVSYNMDWTSRGYVRGYLEAKICAGSQGCATISSYGSGSTAAFNGLPATTPLTVQVAWRDAFMTGSLGSGGPVTVYPSAFVSYS